MTGLPFVARWARNPMLRTAHMGDAVEYPAFPHVRAFFDTGRTYGTADAPRCHDCGADLTTAEHRPAYAPKSDATIKCVSCETTAWARIDASAATMPANPAYSNGWD